MKNILLIIAIGFFAKGFSNPTPTPEKKAFKNTSYDVNFEVDRGKGEVIFYFLSEHMGDYEQIIVERGGQNGGFIPCKTINMADQKVEEGYFTNADKFPTSAKQDAYYRIKTITKEGITKTFPPVLLAALER